jgi:hypothetical protein
MATSKQEQIYNEIIEYYNYAEELLASVDGVSHDLSAEQFVIVEDAVNHLEDCADKLAGKYIEFVKNGESPEITESVREAINDISSKIEECRNRILILYEGRN